MTDSIEAPACSMFPSLQLDIWDFIKLLLYRDGVGDNSGEAICG
jgi:hypothetical protein